MAIEIYEGLKFGKLKVVGFNEEATLRIRKKDKVYNCICECGDIVQMRACHIKNSIQNEHNSRCKRCRKSDIQIFDGMKFGRMTVVGVNIEKTNDVASRGGNNIVYDCICECGKTIHMQDGNIRRTLKDNLDTVCGLCYTFEDWCLDNNHQDYLDLWDYELNNCKPNEISWGVHRDFYFKCSRGIHDSEAKCIGTVTRRDGTGSMVCNKCGSFGQFLIDEFGDDGILKYWSTKNKVNPFLIAAKTNKKYFIKCPYCNTVVKIQCSDFATRKIVSCDCSDSISYPNKFITSLIRQLNIKYKSEKVFKWAKDKRYDHYLYDLDIIIENHGMQHYSGGFEYLSGRGLKEEKENDKLKKKLALSNGIKHYIELDCRYSKLEWIKNSIMNSELPMLLGFKEEDIDWLECEKFALSNLVKYVCDLWSTGDFRSVGELSKFVGLSNNIKSYLKRGSVVGWCNYDPQYEKERCIADKSKAVVMYDSKNNIIGTFPSSSACERAASEMLNVKFVAVAILKCCKNEYGVNKNVYKGYIFKFKK